MALGVSQDWSLAARGCASRTFFVRYLYASKALLTISWKLEGELEDEEGMSEAKSRSIFPLWESLGMAKMQSQICAYWSRLVIIVHTHSGPRDSGSPVIDQRLGSPPLRITPSSPHSSLSRYSSLELTGSPNPANTIS
jgi:hypothetical protein